MCVLWRCDEAFSLPLYYREHDTNCLRLQTLGDQGYVCKEDAILAAVKVCVLICPLEEASAVCTNSTCSAQEECVCLCLSSSVSACCHGRVCDAHGKKGFAFILLAKVTQPGFLYLLSCMGLLSHGLTPFRKLKSPVMTSGCLLSVG